MPPKDSKPKKLDAKELEILRIAEEAKKKEEEDKLKSEELKKFEVKSLSTGLELILTEYCIEEMWKAENPKDFFIDFITKYLIREDLLKNFNNNDLSILAEFQLFNLIFAKEQLHLDNKHSMILLNILWELTKNNNGKYRKSPGNYKKNRENDYEVFKELLMKHCVENPPEGLKYFQPDQLKLILDYAQEGYFNHFQLYQYVDQNLQSEKEIQVIVYIDIPIETAPLAEAKFLGTEKSIIQDEEEQIVIFSQNFRFFQFFYFRNFS